MKKIFFGTILLALVSLLPVTAIAEVNVSIGIGFPLPPVIAFPAPPQVIVLPDTNEVYVVPYVDVDLFFWNGWWWRPWEGRWYRSHYYDRGWAYYRSVPRFYYDVDPGWRAHYREHNWYGHPWHYQPIPHKQLQKNWRSWQENRHWERQRTWNVQGYKPRPTQQRQELRHARQQEYQQRPEVRLHQQEQQRYQQQQKQKQQQQRQPQVQKNQQTQAQQHKEPKINQTQQPRPQPQQRDHQAQQPRPQPQQRDHQAQQPRPQPQQRDHQAQQPRPQPQERGYQSQGGQERGQDRGQGQGQGRGRGGDDR
ncbi:MAG: hypothetical protein ABFD62_11465 [Syntrophaceae bacterium]